MDYKNYLIFIGILLLGAAYFGYPKILTLKPQSSHTWRQADCAGLARIYSQTGLKFFKPQLYNRQEGSGYVVGEFPGLYYAAGVLQKIFGKSDAYLRLINLLILFCGLVAIVDFAYSLLEDKFVSGVIGLLFFTAPVLVFYGNNFLPDPPAFGFLCIGFALFGRFWKSQKLKHWWLAAIFFSLAGLLKITLLISVAALFIVYVLIRMGWLRGVDEHLFPKPRPAFAGFGLILLIVSAWYAYSIWYNQQHDSTYFLNTTFPIWSQEEDMNLLLYTFFRSIFFWSKYYLFPVLTVILIILTPFAFGNSKTTGTFLYSMLVLTMLGSIAFYLLWFYQFKDHEYYIISIYPFFMFLMIALFHIVENKYSHIYHSSYFKPILIVLVLGSAFYAKTTMNDRYHGYLMTSPSKDLYHPGLENFLIDAGVHPHAQVISLPDGSPNVTLHLLNRVGYTNWKDTKGNRISLERMRGYIERGAEFLIIHDEKIKSAAHVKPFLTNQVGKFNSIEVYKLLPGEHSKE